MTRTGADAPTPDEFRAAMQAVLDDTGNALCSGPGMWHEEHDHLMSDTLRALGYGDGVDIFEKSVRWYE